MKQVNRRPWISLSVATGFLVLAGTGLLLYFLKHSNAMAAIHTSFAAVFLIAAGFHIRNNFRALRGYGYKSGERTWAFFKKEFYMALAPVAVLLAGLLYEVPGFSALYDWGNEWRSKQENKQESKYIYQRLQTKAGASNGVAIELDAKKGKAFEFPLFAVWTEDTNGRFLETLYVSKEIGTSRFSFGKKEENGEWVPAVVRRPEAVPYWGHQRGIKGGDGYFLPDPESPVPDVVSAATPTESFKLSTRAESQATTFRIYLEVNQSFDWNDYYSETKFPEDKIYSGSGKVGQPSIVYAATIDLSQNVQYYALNVVGHGHHSGEDGKLDTDLSNLTTALDILDGVMVKILK
jgi:hypothetical protein